MFPILVPSLLHYIGGYIWWRFIAMNTISFTVRFTTTQQPSSHNHLQTCPQMSKNSYSKQQYTCLVFRKKDLYLIITQKLKVKCGAFHMKCGTFHKMQCFSYEKHCAFHEKRCFSWKVLHFSYEKHLKSLKTADSTQISHLDLVFHRVQREGHSWKVPLFMWKVPFFERPLARNCNPMFPFLVRMMEGPGIPILLAVALASCHLSLAESCSVFLAV